MRDGNEIRNMIEVPVPDEFMLNDLAHLAYLQGHHHGVRRCRTLTGTQREIGADVPVELCGRKLAVKAWLRGQIDGYEAELAAFEGTDAAAIADWENSLDVPAEPAGVSSNAIRGAAASLTALAILLAVVLMLAGCGKHSDSTTSAPQKQTEVPATFSCPAGECIEINGCKSCWRTKP